MIRILDVILMLLVAGGAFFTMALWGIYRRV
jgi:hypothetical protein